VRLGWRSTPTRCTWAEVRFNEAEARAPRMVLYLYVPEVLKPCFNEAEARAPRMAPPSDAQRRYAPRASMRPRRVRLGWPEVYHL